MPRRKIAKRANATGAQVQQSTEEPKPKRKITFLGLQDKISVIQHNGDVTNTKLAKIYDVCRGQIKSILQKKEKYLAKCQSNVDISSDLKYKIRSAILCALVHEWVQRARSRGWQVTDVGIRQTAKHVAYLINFKKYQPSPGWLYRFKNKYKLRDLGPPKEVPGPKKSMDVSKIFFELKSERLEEMLDKRFKHPSTEMLEEIETIGLEMQQIKERKNVDHGISSPDSATKDKDLEIHIGGEQEPDEKVSDEEDTLEPIKSYREALDQLELLGNFALSNEDFRVVGLINQLEQLFVEEYFRE